MSESRQVWIGTSWRQKIHVLEQKEGRWCTIAEGGPDCASFLIPGPDGLVIAAVEADDFEGTPGGGIALCKLQKRKIEVCSKIKGLSRGICHVAMSPAKRMIFAASYPEGTVDVLTLDAENQLSIVKRIQRTGAGPHPKQETSHAHCCVLTPNEKILYVCDLGADEIARYDVESLQELDPIKTPPASGPRHLILNQNNSILYVVCELSNEILIMDTQSGILLQRIDCVLHSGEFCALSSIRFLLEDRLLVGCRGQNGFWVLEIEPTGLLKNPKFFMTEKIFPWDVAPIERTYLAAAFTKSNCVQFGRFIQNKWVVEQTYPIKTPTCILTLPSSS